MRKPTGVFCQIGIVISVRHSPDKEKYSHDWFWSSSQNNSNNAWNQNFDNGNQNDNNKNNNNNVRAVRGFTQSNRINPVGLSVISQATFFYGIFMQLELFDDKIPLEDIFTAYYECRKNKRNKTGALQFEVEWKAEQSSANIINFLSIDEP